MAKARGKESVLVLDGVTLSGITNTSVDRKSNSEDVSAYGDDTIVRSGTQLDNAITVDGWYETEAATPTDGRSVILSRLGDNVTFSWYPEGLTGPVTSGTVHVANYAETSPVAGHITWSASLEGSGDWTDA